MSETKPVIDLNRRDFLKGSSLTTLMAMMGGVRVRAADKPKEGPTEYKTTAAPINCAVIGCGSWGRDILNTLSRLPNAPVVAVCDTYEPFLKRGKEAAPKAEGFTDFRKLLEHKPVQAVLVATPTHQHKEIVLAALDAGKHVYCEAPLAATLDDARAIARAAQNHPKLNFQAGLQSRSDPQLHFLLSFIRTGSVGRTLMARSQWHKKQTWRRNSPNPDREKDLNWRLDKNLSTGLIGEIGLHQIDVTSWVLNARPKAVTGYGGTLFWNDGRSVPDTIQAVFEYPAGVNYTYDCTIANSFDSSYDMFYGTEAALMIRDNMAWMFKEVDSPLLGWEVYARKDNFYKETGIALVANATKLTAQGNKPVDDAAADEKPLLFFALEAFVNNSGATAEAVEDFLASFAEADNAALREHIAGIAKTKMPAAGYLEGYEAAVTVIKANEAIVKAQKIQFQPEWFQFA